MASRAVPVPGHMADPWTQAATADPGTQAATADPGTQAATADPGTQAATADPGTQAATADPGTQAATAERGARAASMAGSPPPKFSWGNSSSQGGAQEAWSLGVLGSRTEPAGAQECRTETAGAQESRTEPAGAQEGRTEPALEDAWEAQRLWGALAAHRLGGADKEQALESWM